MLPDRFLDVCICVHTGWNIYLVVEAHYRYELELRPCPDLFSQNPVTARIKFALYSPEQDKYRRVQDKKKPQNVGAVHEGVSFGCAIRIAGFSNRGWNQTCVLA